MIPILSWCLAGSALVLVSIAPLSALDVPTLQVPRAASPPPLDATVPVDDAWKTALVVPTLTPSVDPKRTAGPIPGTEVRLLWDAANLYIRFDCQDTDLYLPFDQHDAQLYLGDVAEVFLDPVGDSRQWFEIQVAANNATFDQNTVLTTEPKSGADGMLNGQILARDWWVWSSYELAGLKTSASVRKDGWTVVLAIPAHSAAQRLGVKTWVSGQKLRGNLMRHDWPLDAQGKRVLLPLNWAPVNAGCPHISPAAMGVLELAP